MYRHWRCPVCAWLFSFPRPVREVECLCGADMVPAHVPPPVEYTTPDVPPRLREVERIMRERPKG